MDVTVSASEVPATSAQKARKHLIADRIAFWLFFLMVFFAPVPDGSISFFWVEIWLGLTALVLVLASYRDVGGAPVVVLAVLIGVLAAYGLVARLQSLSPGPHPLAIWSRTAELLQIDIAPLSSSVSGLPLQFLGRPLLAAAVLSAGLLFGADDRRASLLLKMFIFSACAFGIIGFISKILSLEGMTPFNQDGALTAFFINKNTTATYLGSAFLAALALLIVYFGHALENGEALFGRGGSGMPKGAFAVATAMVLLVLLLPLTQSRAGVLLTTLIAAGALVWRLRLRGRTLFVVLFGIVFLAAAVFAFSGEVLHLRQSRLSVDSDLRWQAYRLIIDAIADRPLLGYGLGSFAESFPQFRTSAMVSSGRFNIGHSTPLELAFEGGLPLALLVVAVVVAVGVILLRGAMRRRRDPYILAALLVGLLGVLHSSVDFSLQMPGYLIICLALVGVGLRRAFLPKEELASRHQHVRRQRRRTGDVSGGASATDGRTSGEAVTADTS